MTLIQARLRSPSGEGVSERTCWVENKIRIRDKITLADSEDPSRLWTVVEVGIIVTNKKEIPRGWKVGGLTEGLA